MHDTASAPIRRRIARWADPAPLAVVRRATDGLTFFRKIAAGELPQPPLYGLLGFSLSGVDPGAARFEGETGEHLLNPFGTVHGGYAATVLDSGCGVALQSMLPQGRGTATIRLEIAFLRPILPAMGRITAASRLIHMGRSVAWSEGEIFGPDGKALTRARGCFAVFPTESGPPAPLPPIAYESKEITWDDPAAGRAEAARMTGLDLIHAWGDGRLPLPPIQRTVQYGMVSAEPGRVVFQCTPGTCHYNPMGGVHGGLAAILVDTAGGAAIQTMQPKGVGATAVNLNVDYFRPITRGTGTIFAEGKLVRAGARIGIADAEVKDAKGDVLARGSVTYLSFPLGAAA